MSYANIFEKKSQKILSLFDDMLYLPIYNARMILRRDIFQAVADPTRRSILILLASQSITAGAIADNFDNARSTISKHIRILTECGLVESKQQGREIYYQIKMEKVKEIDLWMEELKKIWNNRFDFLEKYLEEIQRDKQ